VLPQNGARIWSKRIRKSASGNQYGKIKTEGKLSEKSSADPVYPVSLVVACQPCAFRRRAFRILFSW
jgi:hypothetical protein